MGENELPREELKRIYDIIEDIINFGKELKKNNNEKQLGYLVEEASFDEFKKNIFFNVLRKCVENKTLYKNFSSAKNTFKKFFKFNIFEKYVKIAQFSNADELKNNIYNNQNQYRLIRYSIVNKIYKNHKNKEEIMEKGKISFIIKDKKIIIYLNEKDILNFQIKNGLIDMSTLINSNQINNFERAKKELFNRKANIYKNIIKDNSKYKDLIEEFKNKYKVHLEMLIRLYILYQDNKEKISNEFLDLKKEEKEFYLINSEWIEKFKNFFEYDDLVLYLGKLDRDSINTLFKNNILENQILDLPEEYFNKILAKNEKEINKKIEDISQIDVKINIEEKNIDLKLYTNFQIIDQKIFGLLNILEYSYNPNKSDLYFIGNNNMLLRFQNQQIINSICDVIGSLNEQNIFIPEYIFYYNKENIDISSLNLFFINKFNKDPKRENIYTLGSEDSPIGHCYSLNYLKGIEEQNKNLETNKENQNMENNEEKEDKNISKISGNQNDNENNSNNSNDDNNNQENIKQDEELNSNSESISQKVKSIRINLKEDKESNNNNYDTIYDEINKIKQSKELMKENANSLENELKDKIKILLLMHKLQKEIHEKIEVSPKTTTYKVNECFLLKNEWIDKFNEIFLNEEIKEYLKNLSSEEDIINIEYIYSNYIKNKIQYSQKIAEANLKLNSNDFINLTPNDLSQLNLNKDIFYFLSKRFLYY